MFLFDAHLDLSMNALEWNRDLTRPIRDIRDRERSQTDKPDRGRGTVCLPEVRRGNIGLVVATQIARYAKPTHPLGGWHSPEQAWATTQGQLAWYRAMEEAGEMTQILVQFIMMQTQNTAHCLGQMPDPQTGRAYLNIPMARLLIDQLAVLRAKMTGNLTDEEQRIIDSAINDMEGAFEYVAARTEGFHPGESLVVDPEPRRPYGLAILTGALLGELDADDVPAGRRRGTGQPVLGRDAEEVVGVGHLAVLDEQRVAAEPRPVREDHALAVRRQVDLGQHLVRDVVDVGSRALGDLGGAGVVRVLARRHPLERARHLGGGAGNRRRDRPGARPGAVRIRRRRASLPPAARTRCPLHLQRGSDLVGRESRHAYRVTGRRSDRQA